MMGAPPPGNCKYARHKGSGWPVAGLAHFAFTYRSLTEVLGTYLRMKQWGAAPCWCINHGFTTSIYYHDPDGNMAETQYDNMDMAGADDFMRGRISASTQWASTSTRNC